MKILPIFILWAFLFFLLPKLMGSKKKSTQEDLPNAQQNVPENTQGNTQAPNANMDFWRTWGLEAEPTIVEPMKSEKMEPELRPTTVLKHEHETVSVQEANTSDWVEKPNAWRGKISGKDIKRGLIMKEILGAPRAFNPYGKDV